ncbi:hypothetical protein [Lysinibacillus fusiformis]|uniref:hypothetical protein n=1 Tax=Lysinibacillus fusiformis TaxID=28031 RepID=UPI003D026E34
MFKKIVVITGLLFALVPITNAFAYSGGMLDGKTMQTGANTYTPLGTTTTVTDGDFNTFEDLAGGSGNASVKDHVFYQWSQPQTITYYRLKSNKNSLSIYLYNANKGVIRQIQYANNTGALTEIKSTTGVYYVAVVSNTGVANTVYEFDVFNEAPSLDKTLYNATKLTEKVDGKNVTLTWENPVNSDITFTGTKVYRDDTLLATLQPDQKEYTDTTAEFNKTYSYKVVSTYDIGDSSGSSVKVKIGEDPANIPPVIKGSELSKESNGDYTYTWEEPTKGQVKVLVGGEEYKTVSAADKKITIPAKDMKYTRLNDPDISLVAISENGVLGETTKPPTQLEKTELPFSVGEFIKTGSSLLWWIAPFVLLGLAFFLVPKLRNLITRPFKKGEGGEQDRTAASEGNERAARTTGVRQLRTPTIRRERAAREQRVSRISIKEPRPEREGTKQGRLPREIRKGN